MAKFLTKDIADALCTVITLGFIKYNATSRLFGNQKTEFQYSETTEKNVKNHDAFTQFIKKLGIELRVDEAKPKSTMPCIMAKTKKVPNFESAKGIVEDFWSYITKISNQSGAKDRDNAPYGAYIGGMANIPTVNIIGPSVLSPYTPVYRENSEGSSGEYQVAKKEIDAAVGILQADSLLMKSAHSKKILEDCKCCESMLATIGAGKSFKSYHGMIRAMMEYPPSSNDADVYFEIALGVKTSKVSSCIPCSIFMSANNMAATSTHFGRGDNWAVPDFTSAISLQTGLKAAWIKAVNDHYTEGLALCLKGYSAISKIGIIKKMDDAIKAEKTLITDPLKNLEVIPSIFLEALTFQGPFLEKMAATLGFTYKK
jgi:hypothetical protein